MDQVEIEDLGTDAGLNFELDFNFNVDDLALDDGDFMPLEPLIDFDSSSDRQLSENPESSRPYHAKRPHKKSRAGCQHCKKRKVKVKKAISLMPYSIPIRTNTKAKV